MSLRELMVVFSAFGLLQFPAEAAELQTREEITVQRLVIDAHVTNNSGDPISDLRPADFVVEIDGRPSTVETVEWIPANRPPSRADMEAYVDEGRPLGRLIVLFFQTDFQRFRAGGQMKIIPYAERLLDKFAPHDFIAVVSHDSHLKVRQDFTNDKAKIRKAIHEALRIDDPSVEPADGPVALMNHLELEEARASATPERSLYLIGRALEPVDGPKSVLLFGWGLGVYTAFGVIMHGDYNAARQALDQARTSVFSLDITDADSHSLEVGLSKTAEDTGGLYMKTNQFAQMAVDRVQKVLSGRYELVVKTDVNPGLHRVDVRLNGRPGSVLARRSYVTH
jgi:VWFA-related protein